MEAQQNDNEIFVEALHLYDRQNKLPDALIEVNRALTEFPNSSWGLTLRARIRRDLGDLAGARDDFVRAEGIGVDLAENDDVNGLNREFLGYIRTALGSVHWRLALQKRNRNEWLLACEAYRRALEVVPSDARVWYGLGACQWRLGLIDEAVKALIKSIDCDPDHENAHVTLFQVYFTTFQFVPAYYALKDLYRLMLSKEVGTSRD